MTLTMTKQRSCWLRINDERLTRNEKRFFWGNYMVIRAKQKDEKKKNPDLGEVGSLCLIISIHLSLCHTSAESDGDITTGKVVDRGEGGTSLQFLKRHYEKELCKALICKRV